MIHVRIFDLLSFAAIVGLVFGFFLRDEIGRIEGRIHPVVGPIEIKVIQELDPWTDFSFSGDKLREPEDCQWVETKWYYGVPGSAVPVKFDHLDKPEIRPSGVQEWALNKARIGQEDLLENSFGVAEHDCGGLRWWSVYTILSPAQSGE